MSDSLRQLLARADAASAAPAGPADLAHRIIARGRRRSHRRRVMGGAAVALAIACIAFFAALHHRPAAPHAIPPIAHPATGPSADQLRASLARVESEIRAQTAVADGMMAMERRLAARERLRAAEARPDVLHEIDAQRDDAARLLVYQAQRLMAQPATRPSGVEALQRVIDLFPNSAWASVARQKLAQLETSHS
jgi:hypothetical protein